MIPWGWIKIHSLMTWRRCATAANVSYQMTSCKCCIDCAVHIKKDILKLKCNQSNRVKNLPSFKLDGCSPLYRTYILLIILSVCTKPEHFNIKNRNNFILFVAQKKSPTTTTIDDVVWKGNVLDVVQYIRIHTHKTVISKRELKMW